MLNHSQEVSTSDAAESLSFGDDELVRILKALSEPSRLRIFNMLMEGIQCNCEIAERLGFTLSLTSYHLRVLQEARLVLSKRDTQDARWIYYSIDRAMLAHLDAQLRQLLDVRRIKPRVPSCGPSVC